MQTNAEPTRLSVQEEYRATKVVGISEMTVSNCPDDVIVTYSLGSCVGISLFDPVSRVGGMIHCMLPLSKIDAEKAQRNPCMFADTGIQLLLQKVFELGAERARIQARVAGCGSPLDHQGTFKIGERNHAVMRKVFWKNSILITSEDVGGVTPRTMYLSIATGRTMIRSNGTMQQMA
jgi:chemotaxis protein CheD